MNSMLSFEQFGLSPKILKGIREMGFEEPTPIQLSAIPAILSGRDITGQAQTGTGKTAAFGIAALERIDTKSRRIQVLIISPTRELTIQIAEEIARLARYLPQVTILPVYGGQPIERQLKALNAGVTVVVGTPGRLLDHIRRGTLDLTSARFVVLDEADQMLDMGFLPDITAILTKTPAGRQTLLFSATMPGPIMAISRRFQHNPEFIMVSRDDLTVPEVEQQYIEVHSRDKLDVLCRLLDTHNPKLALVFCNTKRRVDQVTRRLKERGIRAEGLHGDLKQSRRDRVMGQFREGRIDLLVASDVAARGIDVQNIDLVVNYDIPQDVEYYIHRIGRTARAGRQGRAVTFAGPEDIYRLQAIRKLAPVNPATMPVRDEIAEKEPGQKGLFGTIKQMIDAGGLERESALIERIMADDYTSAEIAAALVRLVQNCRMPAGLPQQDAPGLQQESRRVRDKRKRQKR